MLEKEAKDRIVGAHAALDKLRTGGSAIAPRHAEQLLSAAIGPLLETRGYTLENVANARNSGIDFLARRQPTGADAAETIAIELKHTRAPMSLSAVHQLVGAAMLAQVDRAVLVCSAGFTAGARAAIERSSPVQIELIGYDELARWADAIAENPPVPDPVSTAIKIFSRILALEIARNPLALEQLGSGPVKSLATTMLG